MHLETILEIVSRQLSAAGVDCILIGGFAVNYYGYTRNTLDVDFMMLSEQLDTVKQIMMQAGFTNVSVDDTAAFFSAPGAPLRVDFLRVNAETMGKLLANAMVANIHGYAVKVPALKDLMAMKVFALAQNTACRMGKDLADITYLTVLNHLDFELDIRPLCSQYGTPGILALIRDQLKAMDAV